MVPEKHLPKLRGYRLRYKIKADGACVNNALAVALYEDEAEGENVKRRVLNHIVENFDNYYINKIGLPYTETFGVGEESYQVTKVTGEELKKFFMSEEALKVYANYHELLAMANLYNVKIKVFTYGGPVDEWREVSPDPHIVASDGQWVPDVALYHSHETHFDLLVKDDSRIALLGLLAKSQTVESIQDNKHDDTNLEDDWIVVGGKKWESANPKKHKDESTDNEKLLEEVDSMDVETKDIEEEITLIGSKNGGHRRTGPQENPEPRSKMDSTFSCDKCTFIFASNALLKEHSKTHELRLS